MTPSATTPSRATRDVDLRAFLAIRVHRWAEDAGGVLALGLAEQPAPSEMLDELRRTLARGRALRRALDVEGVAPPQELLWPMARIDALLGVLSADLTNAPSDVPVTTWRTAALVLAVSEDTLLLRRKAVGDRSKPWWPSPAAVRAWFAALADRPATRVPREPVPSKRRARVAGPRIRVQGGVVDWSTYEP